MSDRFRYFSDAGRNVMHLEIDIAMRLNHEYIGTEHLLLALLKDPSGRAVRVMNKLGCDSEKIRIAAENFVHPLPDEGKSVTFPLTPRARTVIDHAMEESRKGYRIEIEPEHLLVGLILVRSGIAFHLHCLKELDVEVVRQELQNAPGEV